MNKRIIIGIIIVIVLLIILLIIKNVYFKKNNSKQLELTYKSNGGVPFKWEYEIIDKDIVEFVKSYKIKDKNYKNMVGAPIKTNYVFRGLKEGETSVIFRYINFTNGKIGKEEINKIIVDSNNNISLIDDK